MKFLKKWLFIFLVHINIIGICQTWSSVEGGVTSPGFAPPQVTSMTLHQGKLFVSGDFTYAGTVRVNGVAQWNGNLWDSVQGMYLSGAGFNTMISFNNYLYGGGYYYNINNVPNTAHIAKWNGTNWSSAGSYMNDDPDVYTSNIYNNQLYIGGTLYQFGNQTTNCILKWTGTSWQNVGGGVTGGFITSVNTSVIYKNKLFIGGDFYKAGNVVCRNIASWNGTQWDSLGNGVNEFVTCMAVDTINDYLYVGGMFSSAGGLNTYQLARWNGQAWSTIDPLIITDPRAMVCYHGELYVGGLSKHGLPTDTVLSKWDGTQWIPILGPNSTINCLQVFDDDLYVGGYFDKIDTMTVNAIAKWHTPPSAIIKSKALSPTTLGNNIPNPFTNTTSIPYQLNGNVKGELKIYNLEGRLMKSFILDPCNNSIEVSMEGFEAGIYCYQLFQNGKLIEGKRMVLIK